MSETMKAMSKVAKTAENNVKTVKCNFKTAETDDKTTENNARYIRSKTNVITVEKCFLIKSQQLSKTNQQSKRDV